MRVVEKAEALELLERNRRELLDNDDECLMCAVVSTATANPGWLGQTKHSIVALTRFGMREGHLMIVSKRCASTPLELGLHAFVDLQRLAYAAGVALDRSLRPARTFYASLGATVQMPMTSPHFHVHVLPLYETGESARPANVFSWSQGVVVCEDADLTHLRDVLRGSWPFEEVGLDWTRADSQAG